MKALGLLGVAAFTLASAVVGMRLLLLARRTRQAPEAAMGLAFLASAAIGFPLLIAATVLLETGGATGTSHALTSLGALFTFAGYVGLAVGCWRIYRPSARWPLAPIGLGSVALLAAVAAVAASSDPASAGTRELAFWSGVCVGSLTFAWNALESVLLHRQLRRRLALGLAEPEVVNRILLWGIGSAAAWAMTAHALVLRVTLGLVVADGHRLVSSALGLVAAVAIWLAFFPPAAWRRRFTSPVEGA